MGTSGAGDPTKLSGAIGEVLISTFVGVAFGMIGCVLLGIAIFAQKNQPAWVKGLFGFSLLPLVITVLSNVVNLALRLNR